MCLLAFKPAGDASVPALDDFARASGANPHGIGVAVADGRRVAVRKFPGFAEFAEWHAGAPYAADPARYAVIWHFRLATSGPVSPAMCHPFVLSQNRAAAVAEGRTGLPVMAHNGILSSAAFPNDEGESDTLTFARGFLAWRPLRRLLRDQRTLRLLGEAVGSGNRIALLWPDRSYAIVNEARGQWEGGVWYSGFRGAAALAADTGRAANAPARRSPDPSVRAIFTA